MKLFKNKLVLALALLAIMVTFLPACSQSSPAPAASSLAPASAAGQPTASNPIVIDKQAGELRLAAFVNAKAFTEPTWHAVVYEKSKVADASLFEAYISPDVFHDALKFLGGTPGNNLPMTNYSSMYIQGSDVSVSVTWPGASKTYSLIDVVKDPDGAKGKGITTKFGGNYDRIESGSTGCITCFYSCPMGITSNAAYNGDDFAHQKTAGQAGFLGNKDVLPASGSLVVLTYKVKP